MPDASASWETLFGKSNFSLATLREKGLHEGLADTPFRATCWKLYFGVLPEDQSKWAAATESSRAEYAELRQTLLFDPHEKAEAGGADLAVNNPLSQEADSPWQQYFQDCELREEISRDVSRTFPEVEWFQQQHVQTMMLNILFVYSRGNDGLSYKQGMHELLAPLLFVLEQERASVEVVVSGLAEADGELVRVTSGGEFIEHDAFAVFVKLMDSANVFFQQNTAPRTRAPGRAAGDSGGGGGAGGAAGPFGSNAAAADGPPSAVLKKLKHIQDSLLRTHDPHLHKHLQTLGIEPQLYGLRWLRLLFSREFHFQDMLTLWDSIFADSADLNLADHLCVALLTFIGSQLVACDYTGCLKRLMKFPPVEDVHIFVQSALDIRDPDDRNRARPRKTMPSSFAGGDSASSSPSVGRRGAAAGESGSAAPSSGNPHLIPVSSKASQFLNQVVASVSSATSTVTNTVTKPLNHHAAAHASPSKPSAVPRTSASAASSGRASGDGSANGGGGGEEESGGASGSPVASFLTYFKSANSSSGGGGGGGGAGSAKGASSSGSSGGSGSAAHNVVSVTGGSHSHPKGLARAPDTAPSAAVALSARLDTLLVQRKECALRMEQHLKEIERMVSTGPVHVEELERHLAGLKHVKDVLKGHVTDLDDGAGGDGIFFGPTFAEASTKPVPAATGAVAKKATAPLPANGKASSGGASKAQVASVSTDDPLGVL